MARTEQGVARRRGQARERQSSEAGFDGHLRRTYGIDIDIWYDMWNEQGGACAICKTPFPEARRPHVDHDHATGAVRGLLCGGCNAALGHLEQEGWLGEAMTYLIGGESDG